MLPVLQQLGDAYGFWHFNHKNDAAIKLLCVQQPASNPYYKSPLLFMAALWNWTGHYIFALWFLSSSIFFSFLA